MKMHLYRLPLLSLMFWNLATTEKLQELTLLQDAVNALDNGLKFMEDHVHEINLDGAFGCRLVQELLDAFVTSSPRVLDRLGGNVRHRLLMMSAKAGRIAEAAKYFLEITDPQYYETLGGLLDKTEALMWYPSRITLHSLQVKPVPCSSSVFNETLSDQCLHEIIKPRKDKRDNCNLSDECLAMMTKPRQRGYTITHQVLYFQLAEMRNCLPKSWMKSAFESLQNVLCSNVMRDAEEIADSGYPLNHQDLFMEQIGLCGLWSYKDFYNPEWLRQILQWQRQSGCYADRAKWYCTENLLKQKLRVKRQEKILEDGCLSHKTTVALLALAANIRFNIEKISKTL